VCYACGKHKNALCFEGGAIVARHSSYRTPCCVLYPVLRQRVLPWPLRPSKEKKRTSPPSPVRQMICAPVTCDSMTPNSRWTPGLSLSLVRLSSGVFVAYYYTRIGRKRSSTFFPSC
jgi:hypothetical protein